MLELIELLKNYTIEDALELEKQDLQYRALVKLFLDLNNTKLFFGLILANSLVCYQLSSSGEEYWEEFSNEVDKYFDKEKNCSQIVIFLKHFLQKSKGNKRLLNMKMIRIGKIEIFLEQFIRNLDKYLNNLMFLRDDLAIAMKQKKDAKTIVFTIKMILYGKSISKMETDLDIINQIAIPIDSRLDKIFKKYKEDYTDIKKFYNDLSIKLGIPEIHLDAILWVNYKELVK